MTIVTPSFNQGKYIERTIESVLGQNYPDLEFIVVDGGSTDNTLDILRRYEGRLQWTSEQDRGQSHAINKGFRMASGEIVAWLNSDDVYLPGALQNVGRYFAQHDSVMMVYGEGYMIDADDEIKSRFPFTEPKFDLWKLIYYGDYILQQSSFYRRAVFDSIDMLDESLHYTMDWDLFIRIGKRFRIDYIPEYIGSIREHGEAKTSTGGGARFREIRRLLRIHGVLRYPLAYFNYGWDTYGNRWFPSGHQNGRRRASRLNPLVRRLFQSLYAWYSARLRQGCYPDGWIGKKAMVVLPDLNPDKKKGKLLLEGEAAGPNIPIKVKVAVNRKVAKSFLIERPGPFVLELELSVSSVEDRCFHVEIDCNKTFTPAKLGPSKDARALAFVLKTAKVC